MDCEIKKQSVSFRKTSSRETAVTMGLALALDPENESVRVAILAKQFALGLQEVADEVRTSPVNDDAPPAMKTGSPNSRARTPSAKSAPRPEHERSPLSAMVLAAWREVAELRPFSQSWKQT
jgi:hypothetical protein